MTSALARKSWRELRIRGARSFLTIASIAAAVTGVWILALPPLIDAAMRERIESDLLWDARLSPNGVELSESDLSAIRDLPDVAGIEARVTTGTELRVGDRTSRAWLVSVDRFEGQEVNVVRLLDGELPEPGQVLTDPQNARSGRYTGGIGDRLVLGGHPTTVSGVASSLEFSATVDDADPVFYLPLDRLQAAVGSNRVNWIDVKIDASEPGSAAAAVESVRAYLQELDPDLTYWRAPEIRQPGEWPEKESFDNVIRLTYIIAALGLASALLMVYTTMTTIVREQVREIGIMKAVGGSRRAVTRAYLRTAAILGGTGTLAGLILGILLSNMLVQFAGRQFSGVEAGFGVPVWVLALSIVVGIGGTMLAALPVVRSATSRSVRDALVDHGVSTDFGSGAVDDLIRRIRIRPRSLRLGIRNVVRRKGRSIATGVQVGFAVGTFLGFLALAITVQDVAAATFDGEGGDIKVTGTADAADVLRGVAGVAEVVPVYYADVGIGGEVFPLQGQTPAAAALHTDLADGRWFTSGEEAGASRVAVLGPAAARTLGAGIGDVLEVDTIAGTRLRLEVVGIDTLMVGDGNVVYTPLATAIGLGQGQTPGTYYVIATEAEHEFIDAVASDVRSALATAGLPGDVEVRYIEREAELSSNRTILAMLMILGLPVIAIGLIGLAGTMSTNVVERTREIGILRAIGARARHIRRMIRVEALLLGFLGWLAAIPIGYLIARLLIKLMSDGFGVDFDLRFPMWPLPVALAATLILVALVVSPPARRAVRMQPGEALRYE